MRQNGLRSHVYPFTHEKKYASDKDLLRETIFTLTFDSENYINVNTYTLPTVTIWVKLKLYWTKENEKYAPDTDFTQRKFDLSL